MNIFDWLLLTLTCLVGAMSPGPSLLCVLRHSIAGGRNVGYLASISHAFGVMLWALFTVFALDAANRVVPSIGSFLALAGAAYLIYLGVMSLRAKASSPKHLARENDNGSITAMRDGFAIAFLNPKLAVFFTALFSQFLIFDPSVPEKFMMSWIAAIVDGLWYILVALIATTGSFRELLLANINRVNFVAGALFIFLGLQVVVHVFNS